MNIKPRSHIQILEWHIHRYQSKIFFEIKIVKKMLSILGMTSERKLSLKSDLHLVLFNIVGSNGMS